VDADTGKILWQFQTPSGIIGQPVTWERNGAQYVTVTSGIGGVYARQPDPNLAHIPRGWFALDVQTAAAIGVTGHP
jgi:alcohol dehydrogenase (cytochrome c)